MKNEMPPFLHRKEEYLDRVSKHNTDIRLLARHESLEVMKQKVAQGSTFYMDSSEDWQGFEFVYVLKGKLKYTNSDPGVVLRRGDYISRQGVPEESWFETQTDVTLLYTSTQPAFHLLREEIEDYLKLAKEVEDVEHMDGHSKRLVRMSYEVGKRLGLPPERLADLKYAAFFHDIGKTKIPNRLLEKKGKLSPEEWELMEKHTTWGREMLESSIELDRVGRIVEQTHERLDGSGYPKGLEDDEILLEAKVVSVVDAWDAMRTDRPYRDALTREEAIAELLENKETQFSPEVVDTFLSVLRDQEKITTSLEGRQEYKDETLRRHQRRDLFRFCKQISSAKNISQIEELTLEAVTEVTPFQRAIISIFDRPLDPEDPKPVCVEDYRFRGLAEDQADQIKDQQLVGVEVDVKKFHPSHKLGESYYLPHGTRDKGAPGAAEIESQLEERETLDWHPDDALYIPLCRGEKILGQISVDDPEDGLVPDPETLQPAEALACMAGLGIEYLCLKNEK
ncbi:MAG: HD-GYP domain-containing protein [Candidatus Bipolaricaulota bacterium]